MLATASKEACVQAIRSGEISRLRKLLSGMDDREHCWVDAEGRTLLHHAVLEGRDEFIAMLDVYTVRSHIADSFSMTPLMLALARGEAECEKMLRALRAPLLSEINQVGPASSAATRSVR